MTDLFNGDLPSVLVPIDQSLTLREITPEELGLRFARDGQFDIVIADSRKFAKVFRKRHDHVLRDINSMQQKMSPILGACFFRDEIYFDDYGREKPCIDLTKRGALVLGAHYDPMIAAAVVMAFEAMANELGERSTQHIQPVFDLITAALSRMERAITDKVTTHLEQTFGPAIEALEWIQAFLNRRRVDISPQDQRIHCEVVKVFYGGRCPCCQLTQILDLNGQILMKENGMPVADYDHAKQSATADLHHTWLICTGNRKSCHYQMTHGAQAIAVRLARDHAWCNYQRRVIDYIEQAELQGKLL